MLVLGVEIVMLTGCGTSGVPMSGPGTAAVSPASLCRSQAGSAHGGQPLPAHFQPVAVLQCETNPQAVAGRGLWLVSVERKATRGLGRLLAALRRPNAPVAGNVVCLTDAIMISPFALVSRRGQAVQPTVPTDACGQPQTQTLDALKALSWVTVSLRLVRQIETRAELASGCSPSWDDLFRQDASDLQRAAGGPIFKGKPAMLTVCVFRDVSGSTGDFVRGGRISGPTAATVLRGISGARRSPKCATPHAMFAVLWPTATGQAGPTAYVELGGCDRVLRIHEVIHRSRMVAVEHDELGQATSAVIGIIEHVGTRDS